MPSPAKLIYDSELEQWISIPPESQYAGVKLTKVGMAWTYAKAVTAWTLAGKPERSQEEVERIFEICQSCRYFVNTKKPHCGVCGCHCSKSENPMINKIKMATESCPLDPPKWE